MLNLRQDPPDFIKVINTIEQRELQRETEKYAEARLTQSCWPSEASVKLTDKIVTGECQRSSYYKIKGELPTNPMTLRGRYICDAGLMFESSTIKKFKEFNIFKEEQFRIQYPVPGAKNAITISGKLDVVIDDHGTLKGIEIKTISSYKAGDIFGTDKKIPLPAPNNLMQAMLYKYYVSNVNKESNISEIYLMYIDRSDGNTIYYKVDLDEGFAVITAIDQNGKKLHTVNLKEVKGFDELEKDAGIANNNDSRLAELKINITKVFEKYDELYTKVNSSTLPDKEYDITYDKAQAELQFKLGKISTIKMNKFKKGEALGDKKCLYCNYRDKCLADSGLNLATVPTDED